MMASVTDVYMVAGRKPDGVIEMFSLTADGKLEIDGSFSADPPTASAVALSNVTSAATNGTLLAANADRIGVLVQNDSTATLYLKYGETASATSYSVRMEPGSYWEMPQPIYKGIIDGIWSAANGAARITELE
jgi:hypothetical protein